MKTNYCVGRYAYVGMLAFLVGCSTLLMGCPKVPDVIGKEEEEAVSALRKVKLVPVINRLHHDTVEQGVVFDQDPMAGNPSSLFQEVTIFVSRGPSVVPEVRYMPADEAEAAIRDAGLSIGENIPQYDPSIGEGRAIETYPPSGTTMAVGSEVTLVVSRGKDPMVGQIVVPKNPAPLPLVVDDIPMSMNANISDGSWQWFRFQAVANTKYYVHVTGNAPVNAMVFIGVDLPDSHDQIASMLWTTDPTAPNFYYWVDRTCLPDCVSYPSKNMIVPQGSDLELVSHTDENCEQILKSEKAIMIPNFVAPKTGTYYVVVQAAKMLDCLPNCRPQDILFATYYNVTTYSVQVTTNTSYEDAVRIPTHDPGAGPAPFHQGVVRANRHDWLAFDAQGNSNYMLEFFLTDLSREYAVQATVYSPLGDVACLALACDECSPEPLYTPYEGRYYILVKVGGAPGESGHYNPSDELEFGEFPYILRVLKDDHGNHPALATRIDTPKLNEEIIVSGYLSRADEDWLDFVPAPYSTYRVETRGTHDLSLLGNAAFGPADYDGRNEMIIVRSGKISQPMPPVPFGVVMNGKPYEPFWLQMGIYAVAVIGDDHVDKAIENIAEAVNLTAVGGTASGVLWPTDEDMFAASIKRNYMYKVESKGANNLKAYQANAIGTQLLWVSLSNLEATGLKTLTGYINPYVKGIVEDVDVYLVVDGVDSDVREADYTLSIEQSAHPVYTGMVDEDAGVIPVGGAVTGSLWPGENHLWRFKATKAAFWYRLDTTIVCEDCADLLAAFVEGDCSELVPRPIIKRSDGRWYIELADGDVGENGTDVYIMVWKSDGAAANYRIALAEDDHRNYTGSDENILANASPIASPQGTASGVGWPYDTDVFVVGAVEEEQWVKVTLTSDRLADLDVVNFVQDSQSPSIWWYQVPAGSAPMDVMIPVRNNVDAIIAYNVAVQIQVEVPDVVGMNEADAKKAIESAGLTAVVQRVNDPIVPKDEVKSQDPIAGTRADLGGTVTLIVSDGP